MIAAIEQFLRDTAPAPVEPDAPAPSPWVQTALHEGVEREPRRYGWG